jgi:hypothetical protein
MGFPGIIDHDIILSNCTGQFMRHHTLDKGMTVYDHRMAVMQSLAEIMQHELFSRNSKYWIGQRKGQWLYGLGGATEEG